MTQPPPFGESRYQLDPDDTPTVPKLFAQGDVPAGFWDGPPPAGRPSPGQQDAAGAADGTQRAVRPGPQHVGGAPDPTPAVIYGPPAEREHPRRRALIGVGLTALVTVLVVVAALLIGPHLGSDQADGDGDQQAAPPQTPASTTTSGPASPSGSAQHPIVVPPPGDSTSADQTAGATGSGQDPDAARTSTSVVTVTVTAPDKGAGKAANGKGGKVSKKNGKNVQNGKGGKNGNGGKQGTTKVQQTHRSTASSTAPSSTTSTSTSTTTSPSTSNSASSRYGVPIQQISCSDGYIVQLASELTSDAFAQRVSDLKQQGLVPADAKAASSTKSCQLFTNQTNTLILYAGPFTDPYDACSDRLSGPYDAFIRGANPDTSEEFISCICPASVHDLPTLSKVGTTDQWVGELQRMLAGHLRYRIDDLGIGTWGQYTEDTRDAVGRFQSDNGLPDTGRVDARTWRALQHAGC